MEYTTSVSWSLHELGLAHFNDERLTKRGVLLATSLLTHPQSSIPQSCGSWAATKAAYRFFDNDKVQSAHMLTSHHHQLQERAVDEPIILVAQDTTTLNLSNRTISGIGLVGNGGTRGSRSPLQGLYVHTGLAMTTTGLPLGITSQKVYARKSETTTKSYRATIKLKPISEKETIRWVEAVTEARDILPGKQVVVIGDRESDIYDVFQKGKELGVDLLVRASVNRRLPEEELLLFEAAQQGELLTSYETEIPVDHHTTRKATLTIHLKQFLLPVPKNRKKNIVPTDIPLFALDIQEEQVPLGTDPVHWILLTSLTVTTPEQAIEKVQWYLYRWHIERFHYTLKTGAFNVEKLQFQTIDRFRKAIMLFSLVAQRILHTLYFEREHPSESATSLFSPQELQLLCIREHIPPEMLTCHLALTATAKIGGYLSRKSDGPPGIKALWIGFRALQYMVEGMELGMRQVTR